MNRKSVVFLFSTIITTILPAEPTETANAFAEMLIARSHQEERLQVEDFKDITKATSDFCKYGAETRDWNALTNPIVLSAVEKLADPRNRFKLSNWKEHEDLDLTHALLKLLQSIARGVSKDEAKKVLTVEAATLKNLIMEENHLKTSGATPEKAVQKDVCPPEDYDEIEKMSGRLVNIAWLQTRCFDNLWPDLRRIGLHSKAERKAFICSTGITSEELDKVIRSITDLEPSWLERQ